MMASLKGIAQTLKDNNKRVQLIYSFNGTGKTRLSREFKYLLSPKATQDENQEVQEEQATFACTKLLYYNAYYWDNDLAQDT